MITVKYMDEHYDIAKKFNCGNVYINNALISLCRDKYYGTTYIWLSADNQRIIGFYNITTGHIDNIIDDNYYKSGGSFHINDFALDFDYRGIVNNEELGTTLADELLNDCLNRINMLRQDVGVTYITLESTMEGHSLYERNGFMDLDEELHFATEKKVGECIQMYLPLMLEEA